MEIIAHKNKKVKLAIQVNTLKKDYLKYIQLLETVNRINS
jgi:hypothetical protein